MNHNDVGLVQIIFLSKWVIFRFQPFIFPGFSRVPFAQLRPSLVFGGGGHFLSKLGGLSFAKLRAKPGKTLDPVGPAGVVDGVLGWDDSPFCWRER